MPTTVSENKSLQGKRRRRFYEPLVMLKALSMGHENKISPGRRGAGPAVEPQNAQDRFHSFVYRLAYICANNVGSDTITSVAVMETEGSFSYLFACNQVSAEEGKRISKHIEALLRKVATANQSRGNPGTRCQDEVLKRILRFNRLRIEAYLKRIFQHATKCLEGHQAGGDQDSIMRASLEGLTRSLSGTTLSSKTDDEYVESCLGCIEAIKVFVRACRLVQGHDEDSNSESWRELKHCVSRILAYEEAMKSLFKARVEWPELFDNFKACQIPSSKPESRPLGRTSHSAEAIIGRMTSDPNIMSTFHEYAQDMRKFELDDRLHEECTKSSFKPFIHSEVLAQDWISRVGQKQQLRFFNNWKYIGSSKPPCRMCKYYFEACGSDIVMRASHENIYPNWKLPDAHGPGGSLGARRWQKSLNKLMDKIREDAFKIMVEKCSVGKTHDSNTYEFGSRSSSTYSEPPGSSVKAVSLVADDGSGTDTAELADLLRDGLTLTAHENRDSEGDDDGGALLL